MDGSDPYRGATRAYTDDERRALEEAASLASSSASAGAPGGTTVQRTAPLSSSIPPTASKSTIAPATITPSPAILPLDPSAPVRFSYGDLALYRLHPVLEQDVDDPEVKKKTKIPIRILFGGQKQDVDARCTRCARKGFDCFLWHERYPACQHCYLKGGKQERCSLSSGRRTRQEAREARRLREREERRVVKVEPSEPADPAQDFGEATTVASDGHTRAIASSTGVSSRWIAAPTTLPAIPRADPDSGIYRTPADENKASVRTALSGIDVTAIRAHAPAEAQYPPKSTIKREGATNSTTTSAAPASMCLNSATAHAKGGPQHSTPAHHPAALITQPSAVVESRTMLPAEVGRAKFPGFPHHPITQPSSSTGPPKMTPNRPGGDSSSANGAEAARQKLNQKQRRRLEQINRIESEGVLQTPPCRACAQTNRICKYLEGYKSCGECTRRSKVCHLKRSTNATKGRPPPPPVGSVSASEQRSPTKGPGSREQKAASEAAISAATTSGGAPETEEHSWSNDNGAVRGNAATTGTESASRSARSVSVALCDPELDGEPIVDCEEVSVEDLDGEPIEEDLDGESIDDPSAGRAIASIEARATSTGPHPVSDPDGIAAVATSVSQNRSTLAKRAASDQLANPTIKRPVVKAAQTGGDRQRRLDRVQPGQGQIDAAMASAPELPAFLVGDLNLLNRTLEHVQTRLVPVIRADLQRVTAKYPAKVKHAIVVPLCAQIDYTLHSMTTATSLLINSMSAEQPEQARASVQKIRGELSRNLLNIGEKLGEIGAKATRDVQRMQAMIRMLKAEVDAMDG